MTQAYLHANILVWCTSASAGERGGTPERSPPGQCSRLRWAPVGGGECVPGADVT